MQKIIIFIFILRVINSADLPVLELPKFLANDLNEISNESEMLLNELLKSKLYQLGTNCKRPCTDRDVRICYYVFHMESYQAMGAACGNCSQNVLSDCRRKQCVPVDGIEKGILTLNRQLPGPLIDVCEKDIVIVDVLNKLHSESSSIHWHGILQKETPYMDGVPYVTQCPINPNNNFRYSFWAKEYGTYFYHSHSAIQRYNGIFGGIVVKKIRDPQARYYNRDQHVMILSDWSHESIEMFSVGLPTRPPGLLPQNLLFNGFGKFFVNSTNSWTNSPYETFYVTRGDKFRFRIINAGSTACPMQLQIQNHDMTVIATDGDDVQPRTVNTLFICTGERFDVVVNANKNPGLYWIHLRAVGLCLEQNIYQTAVLSYVARSGDYNMIPNTPRTPAGYPRGVAINDPYIQCGVSSMNLCITDLVNTNPSNIYNRKPDRQIYLGMLISQMDTNRFFAEEKYTSFFNLVNEEIYLATINGLSFALPPSPILSQPNQINPNLFCNENSIPSICNDLQICSCTHAIKIGRNELVEIILYDQINITMPLSHPMHLHGYKFVVLAQERIISNTSLTVKKLKELEKQGRFRGNNKAPPLKDTIALQNQGFVVIRLIADNPGSWLLHCHIDDHLMFGMGAILSVGVNDKPVPWNFPACGNFP